MANGLKSLPWITRWDYAVAHGVQLLDDYDIIHQDLEPFWGIAPELLRSTQRDWEKQDGTYTLASENGHIRVGAHTLGESVDELLPRANEQVRLLSEIARWLPDFRATFTAHDGPYQFIGRELKENAIAAAKLRTRRYLGLSYFVQLIQSLIDFDPESLPHIPYGGWSDGCPANSSLRLVKKWDERPDMEVRHAAQPKTFIHDHHRSMDPCIHPDLVHINGFLSAHGRGPGIRRVIVPAFSMCTTPLHSDIRTIPIEQFTEDVGLDPIWADKSDERVLWRGSNTGILFAEGMPWNISQRARLIMLANEKEGVRKVLRPLGPERAVGRPVEEHVAEMNERMMDIAFAGEPIQCEEPVCTQMKSIFEYRSRMTWPEANKYKYIMDASSSNVCLSAPLTKSTCRLMETAGLRGSSV